MSTEPWRLGAVEAARLLAAHTLSAEALVRSCLDRIEEREPGIHAWVHLAADAALGRARELDAGPVAGGLHGLPIGIKDIFDTFDMPTGHGSAIWRGNRPVCDASVVALARDAGGIILGKTVTTEFATFTPPPTRNPRNTAFSPGGSSSGSAAAVSDGMVPLAYGTQTAGSVIRPAAYCGVVAFKPSYQTLPVAGIKAQAQSLDTVGAYGRSVQDAALAVSALARRADLHPDALQKYAPAIGVYDGRAWGAIEPAMAAALDASARLLERAGARVRTLDLPDPYTRLREAHTAILLYEIAQSLADEMRRFREGITAPLRGLIEKGATITGEDYAAAIALGRAARRGLPDALAGCDVVIAPAATGEAPEGDSTGDTSLNVAWTLLHAPAVALQAGTGPRGLPLGIQVVGPRGSDARTLSAALWIEEALRRAAGNERR